MQDTIDDLVNRVGTVEDDTKSNHNDIQTLREEQADANNNHDDYEALSGEVESLAVKLGEYENIVAE